MGKSENEKIEGRRDKAAGIKSQTNRQGYVTAFMIIYLNCHFDIKNYSFHQQEFKYFSLQFNMENIQESLRAPVSLCCHSLHNKAQWPAMLFP